MEMDIEDAQQAAQKIFGCEIRNVASSIPYLDPTRAVYIDDVLAWAAEFRPDLYAAKAPEPEARAEVHKTRLEKLEQLEKIADRRFETIETRLDVTMERVAEVFKILRSDDARFIDSGSFDRFLSRIDSLEKHLELLQNATDRRFDGLEIRLEDLHEGSDVRKSATLERTPEGETSWQASPGGYCQRCGGAGPCDCATPVRPATLEKTPEGGVVIRDVPPEVLEFPKIEAAKPPDHFEYVELALLKVGDEVKFDGKVRKIEMISYAPGKGRALTVIAFPNQIGFIGYDGALPRKTTRITVEEAAASVRAAEECAAHDNRHIHVRCKACRVSWLERWPEDYGK